MRSSLETLETRTYLAAAAPAPPAIVQPLAARAPAAAARADQLGLTLADRRDLLARLGPGDLASALAKNLRHSGVDAFDRTLLAHMTHRPGPFYFFSTKRLGTYVDYVRKTIPGIADAVVARATDVLAHRFPEQVNSNAYAVQLPAAIDWDARPPGVDNASFVYSLNTFAFWRKLAVAYRYTGDARYAAEVVRQLASWSAQAPAPADADVANAADPRWQTLTAARRADNWVYAYFMLRGSPQWTPAANTLFLKQVWAHGDYLARVTPAGLRKNRTATHANALTQVGVLFPEFAAAAAWERRGADLTFKTLDAQFRPDGGHVEQSPAYTGAVLSGLLDGYRLAELNARPYWTRGRRNRLRNAVEAAYQLLATDAGYSGLSDTYRGSSPREFMTRAGITLGDRRYLLGRLSAEDAFLVTRDRLGWASQYQAYAAGGRGPAYALPDSGYYMMRGDYGHAANADIPYSALQVVFDAGPTGGGHGHFDLFSFELQNKGVDTPIPDPGPFGYDASADRAWAVSTPAHNTVSIDGKSHAAVRADHDPRVVVDRFVAYDDYAMVTAHHHAYEYLDGRPTVGRTLWLDRDDNHPYTTLVAVDWVRSDPGHPHAVTTALNFQDRAVLPAGPGAFDVQLTRTLRMRVQTISPAPFASGVTDSFVSDFPPPDEKTPAKHYAATQTGTWTLFVTAMFDWNPGGMDPQQPGSVEFESTPVEGGPVKLKLTMRDGTVRHLSFAPPDLRPLEEPSTSTAAAE